MGRCQVLAVLLLVSSWGWTQTLAQPASKPQPHSPSPKAATPDTEPWEYSLTVDGYIVSGEDGYAQPTFTADHDWLHLEARYNYENFRTGSLWAGYNFAWGKSWQFEVTPMIGGVFGRTNGIAPGCEFSLAWRKLTFSLDNEYVFDTGSKSGDFYYAWPQITYQPLKWLRVGGVAQHTKMFQSEFAVQQGFLIGLNYKALEFTTYVFDPGTSSATAVLEVGVTF
ncbi:MAG TPA: hypothetical protein VMU45_12440 [Candidatus Eisenbacteria bacterium]|nr:hypothetical protein [Candidatus Eisenbacteria bacterium]